MNPTSKLIFALLLTSLCAHQILGRTPSHDPITQACDSTLYKDLCRKTLESDPHSKGADHHGLAKIALKAASSQATKTQYYIKKLLNSNLGKSIKQSLTDCSENYKDAIEQFANSFPALESKHYNDVVTWVSAAMTDGDSCEDGFGGRPGLKSPITNLNTIFSHLCSNALAITNKLH